MNKKKLSQSKRNKGRTVAHATSRSGACSPSDRACGVVLGCSEGEEKSEAVFIDKCGWLQHNRGL
jgi:hypothetical protein